MSNEINLYPMNYDLLVQFRKCKLPGELPMDTIDRLNSDKNVDPKQQKVGKSVREYCDDIPYNKQNRREFLNAILLVADIDSWNNNIPYRTTKFGHQGKKKELKSGETVCTYQPISSKKITEQAIRLGLYPRFYFQTRTQRRKRSRISELTSQEQESRELQFIQFIDHGTLVDHKLNAVFLEIFEKTGLLPIIELRNAHTGNNACFLIVSLLDSESNSFGLKSAYSKDSQFGIRIEHRDLGVNYELVKNSIKKISQAYGLLLEKISLMKDTYLSIDEKAIIKEQLFDLLFPMRRNSLLNYECDLEFLFQNSFVGNPQSMWDRMITIQKALDHKDGIPYTYVNTNGKTINAKKRLRRKNSGNISSFARRQNILARVFEIFIQIIDLRSKN